MILRVAITDDADWIPMGKERGRPGRMVARVTETNIAISRASVRKAWGTAPRRLQLSIERHRTQPIVRIVEREKGVWHATISRNPKVYSWLKLGGPRLIAKLDVRPGLYPVEVPQQGEIRIYLDRPVAS